MVWLLVVLMFDLGIEEAEIQTHTHIQLCFLFLSTLSTVYQVCC